MITPAEFIRRHILEMTQSELATALKMSQANVCYFEARGKVPEIHRGKMRRLAEAKGRRIEDPWFDELPVVDCSAKVPEVMPAWFREVLDKLPVT